MAHQHLLFNVVSAQVPSIERRVVDTATVRSELLTCIKGTLCCRGDQSFELHSKIFNGDIVIQASVLVRPFDREDVSQVIKFCQRHSLSLSVKAGGYGTHGQAVQGDIILDVSLLNEISIEKMNADGGFTSIKDMPSSRTASKGRDDDDDELMPEAAVGPPSTEHACPSILIGKRRADVAFCDTANASHPMASFLMSGSSFASGSHSLEQGRPTSKLPRTDGFFRSIPPSRPLPPTSSSSALGPIGMARQGITGSDSGEGSSSSSGSDFLSPHSGSGSSFLSHDKSTTTTAATSVRSQTSKSPPPQPDVVGDLSTHATSVDSRMGNAPPSQSDPFGYMSNSPLAMPSVPPLPTFDPSSVVAQPFAQPGSSLFSSAGHYTPTRVNPLYPHAYVTFGAGAKQNDVDVYTASHPLPATSIEGTPCFTPYHVPFSAHPVGASVMILGGFGFLSRLHGLSIDNLVEVEMVLADGSIVVVNETEHPDLWWAIRGAGPAFGVVTRYKAKAYPVPVVFAGNLIYKFRRSTAASLIKHFRDCVKNVPRELYANVILTAGPDGDALLVIQLCYLGTQEQGVEFLQAITSWDGEQCLLNEVSEKSFLSQQESLAQLIRGKPGRKWFIRSDLLSTLTDEMIHETVMRFADTPVGCTWLFELSGGNVSDDHGGCFPASVRQANWTIAAFHQWELDEDDPRCVTTAEDWIKDTLGPASTGGPFPSFFGIHESHQRIKGSFGAHWQRLCQLKRTYDPTGFFTHTFWPLENTAAAVADHQHQHQQEQQQQPKTSLVRTHTEF